MTTPNPELVSELVERIKPILANHPPQVQGCTAAWVMALWLAGFDEDIREAMLQHAITTARELAQAIRGDWKETTH